MSKNTAKSASNQPYCPSCRLRPLRSRLLFEQSELLRQYMDIINEPFDESVVPVGLIRLQSQTLFHECFGIDFNFELVLLLAGLGNVLASRGITSKGLYLQ